METGGNLVGLGANDRAAVEPNLHRPLPEGSGWLECEVGVGLGVGSYLTAPE